MERLTDNFYADSGGNLYVKWGWLEFVYHIPYGCIHSGTKKHRQGESAGWKNVPDPADKRKKLICYTTIPQSTRRTYNLPDEKELRAELPQIAEKDRAWKLYEQLSEAVEAGWRELVPGFTHDTLTAAQAEPYARLQAAFEWCLNKEVLAVYSWSEMLPAFQDLKLPFCPTSRPGSGPMGPYVSFTRKLGKYDEAPDKAAFLLKRQGAQRKNTNRLVLRKPQEDWLIERYANIMKPSREALYGAYLAFIKTSAPEWPKVDLRTVEKMLDKNQPRWYARRHGVEEAKKRLSYTLTKQRTTRPDLLIEVDGTVEPFLFRNEQGKKDGDIYCVRAWDAHSGAMVGSVYGTSETGELVRACVADYLLTHRRQPHQFRFDKGAANLSPVVQELMAKTGATSFPSQARRPTGRSSERLLGEFQYKAQYKLPGYRGSNYRSTRNLDRKVHPDRLKNDWKNETRASIIAKCRQADEDWNNTVPKSDPDGLTRMQRYQLGRLTEGNLSLKRLAELLCVERKRPVCYATHCLKIEGPDGSDYLFEPQLADGSVDFALHHQLAGERAKLTVWELRDGSREMVIVRRADGTGDWLELRAKRIWTESLGDKTPGEQKDLSKHLAAEKVYQQSLLVPSAPATDAADEAPAGAESWRLEQGPDGANKDESNAAELAAIIAESGRGQRAPKAPKTPKATKRAAPVPDHSPRLVSWPMSENLNGEGAEPGLLGLAPNL